MLIIYQAEKIDLCRSCFQVGELPSFPLSILLQPRFPELGASSPPNLSLEEYGKQSSSFSQVVPGQDTSAIDKTCFVDNDGILSC